MHTEVFNNIDTLIEMAGASAKNMDEVNAELITLKRQIRNKTNEIEDFKSILSDARYFNASDELVDKNIEISLKNKIARLKRKIKEIDSNGNTLNSNEESLHEEINSLKKKLNKNEKYVQVLEVKASNNSDNSYYINMLETEKNNVLELRSVLDNKNKEYEDILKELELNNQAKKELEVKLSNEEVRLSDILDNLSNPNAYIDEELKKNDEEKLATLEKDLVALEKRELELVTDASVIGADAKELIAINDIEGAILKIKELVTIVKAKPYMDINNVEILDEELEKKESLRIELAGLIDSKNYEGINSDTIKERINYLNTEIENNNETLAKIKNEISDIDEVISNVLGKKISDLETEIINGEKIVQDYKDLLKLKDNAPKTRTNLEQAIAKKQKEIQVLDNILAAYKDDLLNKINDTNKLNERIKEKENNNSKYLKEQEELQKVTLINFQTKDLVEEEKDKEDLRKLNEEIKQIKIRKQYEKSPNEIYDQIEMALASMKPVPSLREEKNKNLNIDNLIDDSSSKIEEIIESPVEEVLETKEESKADLIDNSKIDINPIPQLEIEGEIAPEPLDTNLGVIDATKEEQKPEVVEETLEEPKIETINLDEKLGEVIEEVKLDEPKKEEKVQEPVNSEEAKEQEVKNRIKVIEMIPVETVKKSGGNV